MQTRRDQLHAYRFQNRRALAALVTGEPNVLEPPMRRLTVITLSGIMIAILVAAGFAVVGIFKPSSGKGWQDAGVVIIEQDTGAKFLYIDKVLHPVLNYASAVLALGANDKVKTVDVDSSDIAGTKRGSALGIVGLPDSLPGAGGLLTGPWTVCSRQSAGDADELDAKVSVTVGSRAAATAAGADSAFLVQTPSSATTYMLYRGHRLAVPDQNILTTLNLRNAATLEVGTSFVTSIPQGPDLAAPKVTDQGAPYSQRVDGATVTIGQLLFASDQNQYFLVLDDGYAQLNAVQTALFRTLPIGPGSQPLAPHETSETEILKLQASKASWPALQSKLQGLPAAVPVVSGAARQNGGLCAVYPDGADQPTFAVPPSSLPSFTPSGVVESAVSQGGHADSVIVPPGSAALAQQGDGGAAVSLVTDSGLAYTAASRATLAGFGYGAAAPVKIPSSVLHLLRDGQPLDPVAARRPAGS